MKRIMLLFIFILFAPCVLLYGCDSNQSATNFEFQPYEYGYAITKYNGNDENVIIPSKYKNKDVIALGTDIVSKDVFDNQNRIKNIVLPNTIKKISKGVFTNCNSLINLSIPSLDFYFGEFFEKTTFLCNDTEKIEPAETIEEYFTYESKQYPYNKPINNGWYYVNRWENINGNIAFVPQMFGDTTNSIYKNIPCIIYTDDGSELNVDTISIPKSIDFTAYYIPKSLKQLTLTNQYTSLNDINLKSLDFNIIIQKNKVEDIEIIGDNEYIIGNFNIDNYSMKVEYTNDNVLNIPMKLNYIDETNLHYLYEEGEHSICIKYDNFEYYWNINVLGKGVTLHFDKNNDSISEGYWKSKITDQYITSKNGCIYPYERYMSNGGYLFIGWYIDKECTILYDFTKPITCDTTVYAGWFKIPDSSTHFEFDIYKSNNSRDNEHVHQCNWSWQYNYFSILKSGTYTIFCKTANTLTLSCNGVITTIYSGGYRSYSFDANAGDIIYLSISSKVINDSKYYVYITGGQLPDDGGKYLECNHNFTKENIIRNETCTTSGLSEKYCNICKCWVNVYTEAKGHHVITDNAVEATCSHTGLTEGSHCDICGEILVPQIETSASHTYGNWIVTKNATSTTNGEEYHTCQKCGHKETAIIPATGTGSDSNGSLNITKQISSKFSSYFPVTVSYYSVKSSSTYTLYVTVSVGNPTSSTLPNRRIEATIDSKNDNKYINIPSGGASTTFVFSNITAGNKILYINVG